MEDFDKDQKIAILKSYLQQFFVEISSELKSDLVDRFPVLGTAAIVGNRNLLIQAGSYFLLNFGKQNFRYTETHKIISDMFDKESASYFCDTDTPFLIVYHLEKTIPNKLLGTVLCQIMDARDLSKKTTLFLLEKPIPELEEHMKERGNVTVNYRRSQSPIQEKAEKRTSTSRVRPIFSPGKKIQYNDDVM